MFSEQRHLTIFPTSLTVPGSTEQAEASVLEIEECEMSGEYPDEA
jgi:hypothetical protein